MNFIGPDQDFLTLAVMGVCAILCLVAIVFGLILGSQEEMKNIIDEIEPTFSKYRIIDERTGNIICNMLINDILIPDHNEIICSKMTELSYSKEIPFENMYYESILKIHYLRFIVEKNNIKTL